MGMKVLIVDDSSIMRKILQRSLGISSALDIESYVEATDGADAMNKFESDGPFSLVFSDIKMPNVDGLEFLKKLGDSPHGGTPVIMVASEGGEQIVMEAIQCGAKGFVLKPFTADQLSAAVRNLF
jgi:two-component system chemotaxis response regulator CheY